MDAHCSAALIETQCGGEKRDEEAKTPLSAACIWRGESRSSAATQRAVMIRESLKRIVGIGQLLIGYSQETKAPLPPLPPHLPGSLSPGQVTMPTSIGQSLLFPSPLHLAPLPFSPLLLCPPTPPPSIHHPTPRCNPQTPPLAPLLEKGPISPLQIEHGACR